MEDAWVEVVEGAARGTKEIEEGDYPWDTEDLLCVLTKTSLRCSGVRLRGGARPDSGQSEMAKEDL